MGHFAGDDSSFCLSSREGFPVGLVRDGLEWIFPRREELDIEPVRRAGKRRKGAIALLVKMLVDVKSDQVYMGEPFPTS